jgi:hypothetical protein
MPMVFQRKKGDAAGVGEIPYTPNDSFLVSN